MRYTCKKDYFLEFASGVQLCFTQGSSYRAIDLRNNGTMFIDNQGDEHFLLLDEMKIHFNSRFIYGK